MRNKPHIGEWNGNPLQYSCLENSMDRAAWRATAYGVLKSGTGGGNGNPLQYSYLENPMDYSMGSQSRTQLSDFHFTMLIMVRP